MVAAAHRQQAENRLEQSRLAGAVRADHGRDGAAANPRRGAVENGHLAVTGKYTIHDQGRIFRAHSSLSARDKLRSRLDCGVSLRRALRDEPAFGQDQNARA